MLLPRTLIAFPLTMTQEDGHVLRLKRKPTKIVSLSLASDEILWRLTEKNKSNQLASLSSMASNPKYSCISSEVKALSQLRGGELENLLKLKPDLVIAAQFNRPDTIKMLNSSGLPYFVQSGFDGYENLWSQIEILGKLTGQIEQSKKLLNNLKQRLKKLKPSLSIQKQNIISYSSNLYLPGQGTSFDAIVHATGHKNVIANVAGEKHWIKLNAEKLLTLKIDQIVVGIAPDENPDEIVKKIGQYNAWSHLPAVKNKKFIFIPNKYLLSTSHCLVNAAEMLNKALNEKS